jgi:hypothetical protein
MFNLNIIINKRNVLYFCRCGQEGGPVKGYLLVIDTSTKLGP